MTYIILRRSGTRRFPGVTPSDGDAFEPFMEEDWNYPTEEAMRVAYGKPNNAGNSNPGTRAFMNAPSGGGGYTSAGFADAFEPYKLVSTALWPKACMMIQPWTDLFPWLNVTLGTTTGPTGGIKYNWPSNMAKVWVRRYGLLSVIGDTIPGVGDVLVNWTTAGNTPATSNSQKMTFDGMVGGVGFGSTQRRSEIANTDDFNMSDEAQNGAGLPWTETIILTAGGSGATLDVSAAPSVGGRWSGHFEHIMLYDRLSSTAFVNGFWLRMYADKSGSLLDETHRARARRFDANLSHATPGVAPTIAYTQHGGNKNRANDFGSQFMIWGPMQAVDGSVYLNPFNVAGGDIRS